MLEAIFDTGIAASVNGKVYKMVVRLGMMFGTDKKTGSGEQGTQNHQPDVPGLAILGVTKITLEYIRETALK